MNFMNRRQFALTTGLVLGGTLFQGCPKQDIIKKPQIIKPKIDYSLISKIDFRTKQKYGIFANIGHQQLYLIDMWNKNYTFIDEYVRNFSFNNPILAYIKAPTLAYIKDEPLALRTFNIYSGKVEEKETLEKYVEVGFDIDGNIVKLPEKPQAREVWTPVPNYNYTSLEARFKKTSNDKEGYQFNRLEIRQNGESRLLNLESIHSDPTRCLGWIEETLIFSIQKLIPKGLYLSTTEIYSFSPKTQEQPELHAVIHGPCWPLVTELLVIGPSDML